MQSTAQFPARFAPMILGTRFPYIECQIHWREPRMCKTPKQIFTYRSGVECFFFLIGARIFRKIYRFAFYAIYINPQTHFPIEYPYKHCMEVVKYNFSKDRVTFYISCLNAL